jgi:hypothetical protein
MVVNRVAFLRIVPLAIMLAGTAWRAARAEDSVTQHADSGSCARSAFRVLIDVGHTATSPGARNDIKRPRTAFTDRGGQIFHKMSHATRLDSSTTIDHQCMLATNFRLANFSNEVFLRKW